MIKGWSAIAIALSLSDTLVDERSLSTSHHSSLKPEIPTLEPERSSSELQVTSELETLTLEDKASTSELQNSSLEPEASASKHEGLTLKLHLSSSEPETLTSELQASTSNLQLSRFNLGWWDNS